MLENPAQSSDCKASKDGKEAFISVMLRVEVVYEGYLSGLHFMCTILCVFYTAPIKFKKPSICVVVMSQLLLVKRLVT